MIPTEIIYLWAGLILIFLFGWWKHWKNAPDENDYL